MTVEPVITYTLKDGTEIDVAYGDGQATILRNGQEPLIIDSLDALKSFANDLDHSQAQKLAQTIGLESDIGSISSRRTRGRTYHDKGLDDKYITDTTKTRTTIQNAEESITWVQDIDVRRGGRAIRESEFNDITGPNGEILTKEQTTAILKEKYGLIDADVLAITALTDDAMVDLKNGQILV